MPASSKSTKKFKSAKKRVKKFKATTQEKTCQKSILNTLSYSSVFNYPLSFYQLSTYLISSKPFTNEQIDTELKKLKRQKKIQNKLGKYYLVGSQPVNWKTRSKNSIKAIQDAKPYFDLLSAIPWVKLLCVTGSVAAHNQKENDDTDIFIVAAKDRLWLTRGFVFLILKITNKLGHDRQAAGKICPNILISEDRMTWDKRKQNEYVAREILMMHPIINKQDTYFKFMKKNEWAYKDYANFYVNTENLASFTNKSSKALDFFEEISMKLQLFYMRNKKTKEVVTKSTIHFNVHDSTSAILSSFKEKQKDLGLN